MTTAITGATGNLGGLVITELIERGVSPTDIVAVVRNARKAASLAERNAEHAVNGRSSRVGLFKVGRYFIGHAAHTFRFTA